MTASLT